MSEQSQNAGPQDADPVASLARRLPQIGDGHPLPIALGAAVPLWIFELQAYTGATRKIVIEQWAQDALAALQETGEAILYRSSKKGESARAFNALAKGIAALSFVPGGVTVFGSKWETKL